jgi:hypothetical protein
VQRLFAIALLSGALSASLQAIPISGTFTLVGTVTVTTTGLIEWTSNTSVASQATISSGATLTGSFVGLGDQTVTINTLTNSSTQQPVNTPFPTPLDFINFTAEPTFPELVANFMPLGSGSAAQCSTNIALAAPNQTCTLNGSTTPAVPGGSPFTLLNTETSVNQVPVCCTSSATWNISGVTSDGLSTWNGLFNATFDVPYQQVLANFVTNGFAEDAYSADITVTLTPPKVPEPSTLGFMGAGVMLLWLGTRKWRKS